MTVVVNKQKLAHWLGISLPTLARWMLRYGAEFPVVERGANGREYQFDAAAVSDFLRARQQEQASQLESRQAEKDEQLAQLRLPFDLPGVEPPPKATSTKDELLAWELRKRQRQEAEAAGKLVPAEPVADAIRAVLARIQTDIHAHLRQIGRECDWPEAFMREQERRLAEMQRAAVAALRAQLGAPVTEEPARAAR